MSARSLPASTTTVSSMQARSLAPARTGAGTVPHPDRSGLDLPALQILSRVAPGRGRREGRTKVPDPDARRSRMGGPQLFSGEPTRRRRSRTARADSAVLKSRTLAAVDRRPRSRSFSSFAPRFTTSPDPRIWPRWRNTSPIESRKIRSLKELAELLRAHLLDHARRSASPSSRRNWPRRPVAAAAHRLRRARSARRGSLRRIGARPSPSCASRLPPATPRAKLDMLDLNAVVLEQAFRSGQKPAAALSRKEQLTRTCRLLRLCRRRRTALAAPVGSAARRESTCWTASAKCPPAKYLQSIRYLERSAGWCRATAARDFGPVMRHYQPVEPLAGGLVDHLLRGSVALPLTARLEMLVADASRAAGIRHSIFGDRSNHGVVALNPGVAIGRLGIIDSPDDNQTIDPAPHLRHPANALRPGADGGHPDARKRQRALAFATAGRESRDSECGRALGAAADAARASRPGTVLRRDARRRGRAAREVEPGARGDQAVGRQGRGAEGAHLDRLRQAAASPRPASFL